MQIPIIVLSLPNSEERRIKIAHRLDVLGLEFEFRDAYSPADVPNSILRIMNINRIGEVEFSGPKTLLPEEIACYASHLKILSDIANGMLPSPIIVLEDDAILDEKSIEFANVIYRIMKYNTDIEYVNFNNAKGPYIVKKISILDDVIIFVPWYSSLGMFAYMVCKEGAKKILRLKSKGKRPIDMEIRHAIWNEDLKYWEAFPAMALHEHGYSTIDKNLYRNTRKEFKKFSYKGLKMLYILKKHGVLNFIKYYPVFLWHKVVKKYANCGRS